MKEFIVNFLVVFGFIFGTIANIGIASELVKYISCSFLNGDVGGAIFLIVMLICSASYSITTKIIIDKMR